jgi:uncharacterized protein (DUF1499 family)
MAIKILLVLVILLLAVCLFFVCLSITAKTPELGVQNGKLAPCPNTPNCVCSEEGPVLTHHVDAFIFSTSPQQALKNLVSVIVSQGGRVVGEQPEYLRAEFTSRIFQFVDDVEFRLDKDSLLIHVRSASRVGHSDFGVNGKRVENIRRQWQESL